MDLGTETSPRAQHAGDPGWRVDAEPQELRIAATFTGGVSLAVWMGGVAHEINLLAAASRHAPEHGLRGASELTAELAERYSNLLDLLNVEVSVDVLSGSSAGGINAAVLGLATVRDCGLAPLRELWLEEGALTSLLAKPGRTQSLLQGDRRLLAGLEKAVAAIAGQPRQAERPDYSYDERKKRTRVFITTTLLEGRPSAFRDDFGDVVEDTDHHGLFTFYGEDLARGQQQEAETLRALALASRCSASFPVAFEPGFVPVTDDVRPFPDMTEYTDLSRSCWVADGGLLVNRPLKPALEAVFDRPAHRDVRRVLAYVVPSPSAPREPEAAVFKEPWPLREALLSDLSAATSQTISDELNAIAGHNRRVTAVRQLRRALAADPDGVQRLAETLFPTFRTLRAEELSAPLVRGLAARPDLADGGGQRVSGERLRTLADGTRQALTDTDRLPRDLPADGSADFQTLASFGWDTFDRARGIVLGVVRAALEAGTREQRPGLLALRADVSSVAPGERLRPRELRRTLDRLRVQFPQNAETPAESLAHAVDEWRRITQPPDELAAAWRKLSTLAVDSRLQDVLARAEQSTKDDVIVGRYLGREAPVAAVRLFWLITVTHSLMREAPDVEQPLELIQMSADSRTALDPLRVRASEKLTGLQAHHFGAFYKSSWRASDWMWGRVDGVGWMVHMLLDPRRIASLAKTQQSPGTWISTSFLDRLTEIAGSCPTAQAHECLSRLAREVEANPDSPQVAQVPLESVALWVAGGLQALVAREELPWVGRTAAADRKAGGGRAAVGFIAAYTELSERTARRSGRGPAPLRDDAQVVQLFRDCQVSREKLRDELRTRLFLRTGGRTILVSAGLAARVVTTRTERRGRQIVTHRRASRSRSATG